METPELLDERDSASSDESPLSSSNSKETENFENDPAFCEKFLQDVDSYWDDIGVRLAVSRTVSDSVFKGMILAVSEEAAEKVASKDAELRLLRDKLKFYESTFGIISEPTSNVVETQDIKAVCDKRFGNEDVNLDYNECLDTLQVAVDELLQDLRNDLKLATNTYASENLNRDLRQASATEKSLISDQRVDALRETLSAAFSQINSVVCSCKASILENKWEYEFQKEVGNMLIRSYVKDLRNDFDTKVYAQKSAFDIIYDNLRSKVNRLSFIRQELDIVSSPLSSSESLDFEEWSSGKRKDNLSRKLSVNYPLISIPHEDNWAISMDKAEDSPKRVLDFVEPPQLISMNKEEVISYYKSEMTKMRRQHDSVLQEKTEELFRLKREFLKERGYSPFRRSKELEELEHLRAKIPEVILKLDNILMDITNMPPAQYNYEELSSFRDRIDALFFENQRLLGLLKDKNDEIMCLSTQVSNRASQISRCSVREASLLKKIEKLKSDLYNTRFEASFGDVLCKGVLSDFVSNKESVLEELDLTAKIMQDVFSLTFRKVATDASGYIGSVTLNHQKEKASVEELVLEKEAALGFQLKDNETLKQTVASLMKENDICASESGPTSIQQKEQFDLVHQQLNMVRDKISEQEKVIMKKQMELDSAVSQFEETSQQIKLYETDIETLNQRNKVLWETLEEAEKENTMLHRLIEEKEKILTLSITESKDQEKQMESVIIPFKVLSRNFADFESRLTQIFKNYELRLKELNFQSEKLVKQANILEKKGLLYKQMLEIKCSNLQKAETEVDLLGDEVDALLSLLGKIYVALDHYSPVLQHYPGVMEILKLVQSELKGENTGLA